MVKIVQPENNPKQICQILDVNQNMAIKVLMVDGTFASLKIDFQSLNLENTKDDLMSLLDMKSSKASKNKPHFSSFTG